MARCLRRTQCIRLRTHAGAHPLPAPQVILRSTWKDSKSDVPAKKSEAFKEYEYNMVRILDKNGKVNQGAIEDAKKIYGPNVIFLGAPTF